MRASPKAAYAAGFLSGAVATVALLTAPVLAGDVDETYRKLRVFSQVLTYVQHSYVDAVDGNSLIYNAIKGMLVGLDPHTTFMRPEEYEKLREDTSGEFGGLGIEVGEEIGGIVPAQTDDAGTEVGCSRQLVGPQRQRLDQMTRLTRFSNSS